MSSGPDREISGEVTRVEAVRRLEGPGAHSVGSLGFLVLGVGLWTAGSSDFAAAALIVAFLVTLNGLSLYGWDRLRLATEASDRESVADSSDRTLSAPSLSDEHKSELGAGFVQAVTLVVIVAFTIAVLQWFGVETGAALLAALIAVGNLGLLALTMR